MRLYINKQFTYWNTGSLSNCSLENQKVGQDPGLYVFVYNETALNKEEDH